MALFRTRHMIINLKNQRLFSVLCKTITENTVSINKYPVQIISQRYLFWEKHRKGGYNTTDTISYFEHMKNGYKELKHECKLFAAEVKELFESDPILISRPGKIFFSAGTEF